MFVPCLWLSHLGSVELSSFDSADRFASESVGYTQEDRTLKKCQNHCEF